MINYFQLSLWHALLDKINIGTHGPFRRALVSQGMVLEDDYDEWNRSLMLDGEQA